MFDSSKQKFKNFLGHFSYRRRFIFWVVIVFLVVPVPSYWILTTQYFFRSRASLNLQGSQEAKLWLKVFDGIVNNYIEWTCRIASGEGDSNEQITLKRTVSEALETLKNHSLISEKEILTRKGLFVEGKIIKSNKEDLIFLEKIWEKISNPADIKDIKGHEALFRQCIVKISQKIHEIAYDYHLILQTEKTTQVLAQSIYFSFLRDQILLVDLNQIIANLLDNGELRRDVLDQATLAINYLKEHFESTKSTLESTYQQLQDSSIWKEVSYNEVQERLAYCYELNIRLIDRVKANLITVENEKQPWPSTNSLFIKNADCMEKCRNIANQIFEDVLRKDKWFYLWQQVIVIIALFFFVFLLIVFIIFRFLTSHFKQMHGYILGLSRGNFSTKMNTNPHEEMGQIALAFQKMGKSIKEVVDQLKALGLGLAESSEKIEMTAHEQAKAVTIQENSLVNLDSNIKKISSNSRELADTMDAFTQISKERLEKDESNKGLEHLQNKMNILKNASTNILEILLSVHEKGLNTRKLTSYMTKISDQASLLALNAAIESLNVGKQQSFDDITGKIQHFAETTSASTLAIQKIVNDMSESVALGKLTTESCIKEITLGANRLIEVSHQLQTITSQDVIQNDKFHHVNTMMQNQAKRSEEIIKLVTDLNLISKENTHSVDMLYHTISELGISSQELRAIVRTLFSEEGAQ